MNTGVWHQLGDKSQIVVKEHLKNNVGVGVIVSPRDLASHKAVEHSADYRALGAKVLFDPQFFGSGWTNKQMSSYEFAPARISVCKKIAATAAHLDHLSKYLESINRKVGASGVIAPALIYEAGQPNLYDLNSKLFQSGSAAGTALGVPTYATILIGKSAASTSANLNAAISHATSLGADGWYFGFEFDEERIPLSAPMLDLFCDAMVTLAATGKPVMHAFSSMMGLVALGTGAQAVGIGANQNLWQFTRDRWAASTPGGGGNADAPQRFFCTNLWGTIIYRDEFAAISQESREKIHCVSPYNKRVTLKGPFLPWDRESAKKHLVHVVGSTLGEIAKEKGIRKRAAKSISILDTAISAHKKISDEHVSLGDRTSLYQKPWKTAIERTLVSRKVDLDFMEL